MCVHKCFFNTEDHNQSFLRVFATIGIISTVIRLLLEGVQLLRNHFYYFLDLENWLEVCLFIGSIIFMISGLQSRCFCPTSWQWQLGAMVVFIAWLNMVLFLKKLYLTGIYVVMFVDILYTFMKMILLSVLFVISFGLAFYMLFFRPVSVCICVWMHMCIMCIYMHIHAVHIFMLNKNI